jgi:hypothetical protein
MKTLEPSNQAPDNGGRDLFIREDDRELCVGFCNAIEKENKNLMIVGPTDGIVEHYCGLIVRQMLSSRNIRLKIQSASSTAELLDKFNEILSSLSTAEAMVGRNPAEPIRLWISGTSDLASPVEIRLLARLISSFPGANIQLILLHVGSETKHPMDVLGRNLLKWVVPPISQEEAESLVLRSKKEGEESNAINLLNSIAPGLLPDKESEKQAKANNDVDVNQNAGDDPEETPPDPILDGAYEWKPVPETIPWKLFFNVLIGICLLFFAVIIISPIFPKQVRELWRLLKSQPELQTEISKQPVTSDADSSQLPSPQINKPTETSRSGNHIGPLVWTAPGSPANVTGQVGDNNLSKISPSTNTTETANLSPKVPGEKSPEINTKVDGVSTESGKMQTPSTTAPKPNNSEKTIKDEKASTALTDSAIILKRKDAESPGKTDKQTVTGTQAPVTRLETRRTKSEDAQNSAMEAAIRVVRETPKNMTFVQHIALNTYEEALEWRSDFPAIVKALVVPVTTSPNGAIKFVVASGPFELRASADSFSKKPGVPPNPWLRSASSLREALRIQNKTQTGKN